MYGSIRSQILPEYPIPLHRLNCQRRILAAFTACALKMLAKSRGRPLAVGVDPWKVSPATDHITLLDDEEEAGLSVDFSQVVVLEGVVMCVVVFVRRVVHDLEWLHVV